MKATTLRPHIREEPAGWSWAFSASAHATLLAAVTLGSALCQPGLSEAGDNGGFGSGSIFPVALSGEVTGGAGNVAPALTPAPQVVKREKAPRAPEKPEKAVELPTFRDPNPDTRKEDKEAPAPPRPEQGADPVAGTIPAEALAGIGGQPGGLPGSATGLRIGSGQGGPGVASWYVRQLEQRIARNWLQAPLGGITGRVLTQISFAIAPGGHIENIQVLESSGDSGVDRAAQRAVQASSPLPPLPVELRGRRVEFVAHFEYPPR